MREPYGYTPERLPDRAEYPIIEGWVRPNERVLDVCSGPGALSLRLLERGASVVAIDVDKDAVEIARSHGVDARQVDVDDGLPFDDHEFDVAICNVSLVSLYRPGFALDEILRVGRRSIVSFPNLGYWRNRAHLVLGHSPKPILHGHHWWDTRQIHNFTDHDFRSRLAALGVQVSRMEAFGADALTPTRLARAFPNWWAMVCIYELETVDAY